MDRTRTALGPTLVSLAVASCFAAGTALAAQPTLPTGGVPVIGVQSINPIGNSLNIVTNAQRSIAHFQTFSVGTGYSVNIQQPSATSAHLSRVVGGDPSSILGSVSSNGKFFLINPNGIVFGANAQINVAGLVASSLNLTDQDFIDGKMRFVGAAGAGSVENLARPSKDFPDAGITTPSGGQVYLIGSSVINNGLIRSPQGEVILAAGSSVELVSPGTPNLRVEIAALDHEARNLGQIISDAGRIGIYAGLINNSGTIRADSAVSEGGRIVLKAMKNATLQAGSVTTANGARGGSVSVQSGGTTLISGQVEAKGTNGPGGTVQALGHLVGLIGNASINASGATGGGTVLVGGDFQGKNADVQNAFRTYFGADATIRADAATSGDGGKVIVWADDATLAHGTISARGGAQSGDGGFVEVSGKWLDFNAGVDVRAPKGTAGSLLLDPTNIWIAANQASATAAGMVGTDLSANVDNQQGFFAAIGTVSDSLLTTGVLNGVLAGGAGFIMVSSFNSTGTGLGNITVVDPVSWATTATLNLDAANNIDLRAPLNGPQGSVFLSAGNSITQTPGGAITTGQLYANAQNGNVLLNTANNSVNLITGHANSQFLFKNAQSLEIGLINQAESSGIQVTNAGPASINVNVTSGDLMVTSPILADAGIFSSSDVLGSPASVTLTAAGMITVAGSGSVVAFGGAGRDTGGNATITMTATGMTLDNANVWAGGFPIPNCDCITPQIGGNGAVSLNALGGTINLMNGAVVEASGGNGITAAGSAQINLSFTGRATGGYFINGVEGLIVDGDLRVSTGFFVNGLPAVLKQNLFLTYINDLTFTNTLVAAMNTQADVLADQLKAGETGEDKDKDKKKLPFCSS